MRALEVDAAWAVTAGARRTTSAAAAGEHCYAGVSPGSRARDQRVEALAAVAAAAVLLLAANSKRLVVQGSSSPACYSFESLLLLLLRQRHWGVIHHVPLPLQTAS